MGVSPSPVADLAVSLVPVQDVAGASPVPMKMGKPSLGADFTGPSPVLVHKSWDEPSHGADVAGASPVPVQMWQEQAQPRRRSMHALRPLRGGTRAARRTMCC